MQKTPTIYIVDDEPQVLEAVAHLVKPMGANVETFSRADDFLGKFRDEGPACLVLDVRMPGLSGLELQAKLIEIGCRIPVIIVTGHADVRMAVDAVKAGAAGFLEKPFRPQELFDEIQKTLRADIESWRRRTEEQSTERLLARLKPGERQVIDLIVEGRTNDEIASDLRLSVRGVEARRAKAMKALNIDTKAELIDLLRTTASH